MARAGLWESAGKALRKGELLASSDSGSLSGLEGGTSVTIPKFQESGPTEDRCQKQGKDLTLGQGDGFSLRLLDLAGLVRHGSLHVQLGNQERIKT